MGFDMIRVFTEKYFQQTLIIFFHWMLLLLSILNAFRLLGKRFECWFWTSNCLWNVKSLRWNQKFIFLIRINIHIYIYIIYMYIYYIYIYIYIYLVYLYIYIYLFIYILKRIKGDNSLLNTWLCKTWFLENKKWNNNNNNNDNNSTGGAQDVLPSKVTLAQSKIFRWWYP